MTRIALAALALCAVVTGVPFAQTPAPRAPRPQPAPSPPPAVAATPAMTLTGCLKPWDTSTMGPATPSSPVGSEPTIAPSHAAPAAGAERFVLIEAEAEATSAVAPAPGAPAPPSGASPVAGGHRTLLLQAQSALVDLASHANHKVRVMGAMTTAAAATWFRAPGAAAPDAPDPGTSRAGAATSPTAWTPPPAFVVSSITMIAKSCE